MEKIKAPGLRWRKRANGREVPYWIAASDAVAAGYPVKSVNLSHLDPDAIEARCNRLQSEMLMWLSAKDSGEVMFDGTFASLFDLYERHEDSPFQRLAPASRVPYLAYLKRMRAMIGSLRIEQQTGLDLVRWHRQWRGADEDGSRETLGAAAMATAVLKSALSFGVSARLRGCLEFYSAARATRLKRPRSRTVAPTADDVIAVRRAAHEIGRPSLALAYALQFETSLRQWDVIGQWYDLSAPFASPVIGYGMKWAGLTWADIDAALILRLQPQKTAETTSAKVECDLTLCPMVLEEIASIPPEARVGPVIVSETSGLPWRAQNYRHAWRRIAKMANLSGAMWNRDLRAGAVTEARKSGAAMEDASKMAGHKGMRTTSRVYDRDVLEASRRAQVSRTKFRNGDGG